MVEGREAMDPPHWVRGAQDRYRTGEAYPVGACRRGCENDRGSGIEKFPTVMLADSKRVQANLIGVLDLLHQVAQPNRRVDRSAGVVVRRCEAVNADLQLRPRPILPGGAGPRAPSRSLHWPVVTAPG